MAVSLNSSDRVDINALRTNQVVIVATVLVAFVLGADGGGAWLVALLSASMAIGAIAPGYGPIQVLYRRILVSRGLIKPHPRPEDPAQHRFAQSMGATVLGIAAVLLFAGFEAAGWTLAWIVVSLALVNLLFNFCAGCFIFLQLRRAGVMS